MIPAFGDHLQGVAALQGRKVRHTLLLPVLTHPTDNHLAVRLRDAAEAAQSKRRLADENSLLTMES